MQANTQFATAGRAFPSRRMLWGIAFVAVLGSAALGWKWLVATGVASLLLSVLPCLAMCALGMCMNRRPGGGSCHGNDANPVAPQKQPGDSP